MPKDEFDFDDPMELNGMALLSDEDTTDAMTECFIEEFLWLGWNHQQVLALFRNPHYVGMNMVLENRGESYVKDFITEIYARWGQAVEFAPRNGAQEERKKSDPETPTAPAQSALDSTACDPMGAAIPRLDI